MPDHKINILAISGSLRADSSNNAVINTVAKMMPEYVGFAIYRGLGTLPHFNDSKEPATEVVEFRKMLRAADGVLICSPEYAFGVPGVLKNALDWTVSSGEFVNKPVALITAATGGDKAHASLQLTFTALSAHIPEECKLLISFVRSKLNENSEVKDATTLDAIQVVVDALVASISKIEYTE
jgi:chromate reductase, NAD(P)H dehydrogenase (quinone)